MSVQKIRIRIIIFVTKMFFLRKNLCEKSAYNSLKLITSFNRYSVSIIAKVW